MTNRQTTKVSWSSDRIDGVGTYCLILRLKKTARIRIGAMGHMAFPQGWYAYMGSAFGPGGLRARLRRHFHPSHRFHWHIDYFRQSAEAEGAFFTEAPISYEHVWAASVEAIPGASIPARGFGASDCRCPAHLFYF